MFLFSPFSKLEEKTAIYQTYEAQSRENFQRRFIVYLQYIKQYPEARILLLKKKNLSTPSSLIVLFFSGTYPIKGLKSKHMASNCDHSSLPWPKAYQIILIYQLFPCRNSLIKCLVLPLKMNLAQQLFWVLILEALPSMIIFLEMRIKP